MQDEIREEIDKEDAVNARWAVVIASIVTLVVVCWLCKTNAPVIFSAVLVPASWLVTFAVAFGLIFLGRFAVLGVQCHLDSDTTKPPK